MQRKHPEFEQHIDEAVDAAGELILVGEEGDEHADRQIAIDHRAYTEIDDQQTVDAEQGGACRLEPGIEFLHSQFGVHALDQMVDPAFPATRFDVQDLEAADAAHRFHEMGIFLRRLADGFLGQRAIGAVGEHPHEGV